MSNNRDQNRARVISEEEADIMRQRREELAMRAQSAQNQAGLPAAPRRMPQKGLQLVPHPSARSGDPVRVIRKNRARVLESDDEVRENRPRILESDDDDIADQRILRRRTTRQLPDDELVDLGTNPQNEDDEGQYHPTRVVQLIRCPACETHFRYAYHIVPEDDIPEDDEEQ